MDFGEKSEPKVPRSSKISGGRNDKGISLRPAEAAEKEMKKKKHQPALAPASLLRDFVLENLACKTMHDRDPTELTARMGADVLGLIYWITEKTWLWQINPDAIPVPACVYAWSAAAVVPRQTPFPGGLLLLDERFERDQCSQTGVLRSLLHQLPSSNMELIPSTFPVPWQNLRVTATKERTRLALNWSATELLVRLSEVAGCDSTSALGICFSHNVQRGDRLLDEIVTKADGVFLWVGLAVSELMGRWDMLGQALKDWCRRSISSRAP
ncbi:hypothetical protein AAL_03291 [Moelleriella libera RCEF 2490]|uniref:Uncharacterized protein n=1 Tax=Moelleriella libera RCEF 2490 TaxID=1081109 RepID=A0A168D400_9HYPO|nr:hypothetical protein AAL_03291 [Moelleriella libera RCEF 2490]